MKERPIPSNVRTRTHAEATILRANDIQHEDPFQEREKYQDMLKEVQKKRMLLQ
jgi:hypothetical protein